LRLEKWGKKYLPLPVLCHAERVARSAPDELTAAYLINEVVAQRQHLWLGWEGDDLMLALFAEIRHYYATGKTFIRVAGIAGERVKEALPLLADIEQWGRSVGACKVVAVGRKGWEPVLRPLGYEIEAVVLSKQLGDENV
jgi:hypothetical protein